MQRSKQPQSAQTKFKSARFPRSRPLQPQSNRRAATTSHSPSVSKHQSTCASTTPRSPPVISTRSLPVQFTAKRLTTRSSSLPSVKVSPNSPLYRLIHQDLTPQPQSRHINAVLRRAQHIRSFSTKTPNNDPSAPPTKLDQLEGDVKFDEILSKVLSESGQVLQSSQARLDQQLAQLNQLKPPQHIITPVPHLNTSLDTSVRNILNQSTPSPPPSSQPGKTIKIQLHNDGDDGDNFESLLRKSHTPTITPPAAIPSPSIKQQNAQPNLKSAPEPTKHKTPNKPFAGRSSAQSSDLYSQLGHSKIDTPAKSTTPNTATSTTSTPPTTTSTTSTTPTTPTTTSAPKPSFMAQFQGFVDKMDQDEIKSSPNAANYHIRQQNEQRAKEEAERGLFGAKTTTMAEDISVKPSPYANRKMADILTVHNVTSKRQQLGEERYDGSFRKSISAVLFFGAISAITANLCWWQINRRWWKLALIAAREDAIFQDPMLMQELTDLVTELLVEYDMYDFGSDQPGSAIHPPIDHEKTPTVRQILAQKLEAFKVIIDQIANGTFDGSSIRHRSGATLKPTPPLELQPGEQPQDLAALVYRQQHAPLYPTDLAGNPLDIPASELLNQVSFDNILDAISMFKEKSQFHNITAHGRFDYSKEMFVGPTVPPIDGAFKNIETQKGYFVVTPLQLYAPIQVNIPVADDTGVHKINLKMVLHHVLVNRGWIPQHIIQTYASSPIPEHELYSQEDLDIFDRLIRQKYDRTPEDSNPITPPPFPQYINYLPENVNKTHGDAKTSATWSLSTLLGESYPMESEAKSVDSSSQPPPQPHTPSVTQYSIDYAPSRPAQPSNPNSLKDLPSNTLPPPTPSQLGANAAWNEEITSRLIYEEHGLSKVKLDRLGVTMNEVFKMRPGDRAPFSIISNKTGGQLDSPLQPVNGVLHYGATYDLYSQAEQTAKIKIRGTEIDAYTFLTGPKFAVKMGVAPSTFHFPDGKVISLLSRDQLDAPASDVALALHLPVPVIDSNDPVPSRRVVPVPSEAQHFDSIRLSLKRKSTDDHVKFKTMPETHAGYAVTWGSFSAIGAYLAAIQFTKPVVKDTVKEYFSRVAETFSSASKAKPKVNQTSPKDV